MVSNDTLTIQEYARKLGVSTKTIRRWEAEGKIKSTRTEGGHRRFVLDEKSFHLDQKTVLLALTISIVASLFTYFVTRQYYQNQLAILSGQFSSYLNHSPNTPANFSASSGIGQISADDNGQVFIASSQVKSDSVIDLTPTDPSIKLQLAGQFPGLGFIVTSSTTTQPTYFNWQIR